MRVIMLSNRTRPGLLPNAKPQLMQLLGAAHPGSVVAAAQAAESLARALPGWEVTAEAAHANGADEGAGAAWLRVIATGDVYKMYANAGAWPALAVALPPGIFVAPVLEYVTEIQHTDQSPRPVEHGTPNDLAAWIADRGPAVGLDASDAAQLVARDLAVALRRQAPADPTAVLYSDGGHVQLVVTAPLGDDHPLHPGLAGAMPPAPPRFGWRARF